MKIIALIKLILAQREWILAQKDLIIKVVRFVGPMFGATTATIELIVQAIEFVADLLGPTAPLFATAESRAVQFPAILAACEAEGVTMDELATVVREFEPEPMEENQ